MLAVDGQQGGAALAHSAHEQITTHHQRLFVGQQQALARAGSSKARRQARSPHDGSHDGIHLIVRRYDFKSAWRLQDGRWKPILLDFFCQQLRMGSARHDSEVGLELGALLQHQIDLGRRAERKDLVAIRVPRHHVERVFSDGPRGAQNREL